MGVIFKNTLLKPRIIPGVGAFNGDPIVMARPMFGTNRLGFNTTFLSGIHPDFLLGPAAVVPSRPMFLAGLGKGSMKTSIGAVAPNILIITGVSRDSSGVIIPNCTMNLFKVDSTGTYKTYTHMGTTISDGSGNYSFVVGAGAYRVTGDNAAETLAGLTLNNISGS
jgi:hypothetical protein